MISLVADIAGKESPSILCLGAHSDDIEIGAGATILSLQQQVPNARITWVVFAGSGPRAQEAEGSARHCTAGFADASIEIHEIRDGYFPSEFVQIKETFEPIRAVCHPDIVFTHQRDDLHQDHRLISEITLQTFRDHLILEYEIPKYDGDLGTPNLFVPVSDEIRLAKLGLLDRFFASQRNRPWFTRETFEAVMRLRGVECRSPSGYAEAFHCRKAVLATAGSQADGPRS
jgi:LmbE family N-acetylglucosaminyl deacetylase